MNQPFFGALRPLGRTSVPSATASTAASHFAVLQRALTTGQADAVIDALVQQQNQLTYLLGRMEAFGKTLRAAKLGGPLDSNKATVWYGLGPEGASMPLQIL